MATASGVAASSSSNTPLSQTQAQGQKVDFDSCYEKGKVYVFPPIQQSRVKVFKKTQIEIPADPALALPPPRHALEADEAKMESGKDKLQGEEVETTVVTLLYNQLHQAALPGDSPSFLFSSLMLDNHEKDIVIFHEKYGVIVVEVKALKNPRTFSRLQKAAEQLLKARNAIRTELQGLLEPDAISLLIALPNLTDPGDARQRMQILRDNPDIQLLCGGKEDDYKAWLQQLTTRPAPWGGQAQPDSHQAFVQAVSNHLSVPRYSPSQTVLDLSRHHETWLITPAQAEVLHRQERLLHIWGPPGAGKTVLLLHQARRWLAEGNAVIIAVGVFTHSVLLQQLGRAVLKGQGAEASDRVVLCREGRMLQATAEQLRTRVSPAVVCAIVDEVERVNFLRPALDAFHSQHISCLWSASVTDLPGNISADFSSLGGHRINLPHSLRCPSHVMEQAGRLVEASPRTPAMAVFPCLPASLPTASVKVTLHPSHPHFLPPSPPDYHSSLEDSPSFDCGECSQWLRSSLPPLVEGLPLTSEQWRHWVILGTGEIGVASDVTEKLVQWLRQHGVPAVCEPEGRDLSNISAPSLQGQGSEGMDEKGSRRERLVAGLDTQQHPAVHIVPASRYTGLEKSGVLVMHWDREDERPEHQSQPKQETRLSRHRDQLFRAVTRCQADVCVWLLSPTPAACLLP